MTAIEKAEERFHYFRAKYLKRKKKIFVINEKRHIEKLNDLRQDAFTCLDVMNHLINDYVSLSNMMIEIRGDKELSQDEQERRFRIIKQARALVGIPPSMFDFYNRNYGVDTHFRSELV